MNHLFDGARGGGEGGSLVIFVVRGTAIFGVPLTTSYGSMGIIFTIFRHFTELWVSFSGDFS